MKQAIALLLGSIVAIAQPAMSAPLSADDFLRLFASFEELKDRKWSAGRAAQEVKDKGRPTDKLIKRLKRDPYNWGYGKVGRTLTQRGAAALPTLLKELDGAEAYYRMSLLNILRGIPAPERDAAFLRQLEQLLIEERSFLADDMAATLMRTLADREIRDAVPLLQKFAKAGGMERETRAEARIALGRLGALEQSFLPEVPYEVGSDLPVESLRTQLTLLESVLKYELLRTPLNVTEFESGDVATTVLRGTIEEGTWYVRFGTEQSGRVPVYYSWHTGPLAAEGYIGVLERAGDQWLVVFWQMVWIS